MSEDDGLRVLTKFASVLATLDSGLAPVPRLCESARLTVGADAASVTIKLLSGGWSVLWATDPVTERFEQLQQLAGEGPVHDVASTGLPLFIPAGETGLDTWSTLSVVAERDLIGGNYWVIPMRPVEVVVGVLTLHRASGELLEGSASVQVVADTVGTALIGSARTQENSQQVEGVWADRAEIHQAAGMVIAQLGLAPDDAVALLRAHAFSRNLDLHDVALDVIERRIDFSQSGE